LLLIDQTGHREATSLPLFKLSANAMLFARLSPICYQSTVAPAINSSRAIILRTKRAIETNHETLHPDSFCPGDTDIRDMLSKKLFRYRISGMADLVRCMPVCQLYPSTGTEYVTTPFSLENTYHIEMPDNSKIGT
jgi:hypothetical protein